MSRSRDIAKILGVTEDNNPSNSRILFLDESLDSARVTSIADTTAPSLTVYDSINELPVQSLTAGAQAYVRSNNKLYVTLNNAYYNIATVNLTPTVSLDPSGTIVLSDSGQPSAIVTINATDSDGSLANLTYTVESDGNMLGRATLTQDSSVFTIDPLSADSGATDGTFTLTFKANDGINIGTAAKDFSLTFAAAGVDSSAPTVLLMKSRVNALNNTAITYRNSSDALTGFTEAGDPQATTFNPYRSGGYSTYHDGTGDKLSIGSSSDFAYGTGDFTWEAWIYVPGAKSNHYLLDHGSNGGIMNIANNKIRYYNTTVGTAGALYTGVTIEYSKWHHVAFVRSSGTTKIYVDGVSGASQSDNHNYSAQAVTVGDYGGNNYGFSGYVRDLRLVKGTAVYTSNFTPPTETLTAISGTSLLLSHLPYIADGSSTGHTVTINGDTKTVPFGPYDYEVWSLTDHGNSVHFDGTGDYITPNAITAPGTGAVTYEAWVRQENGGSSNHTIFDASTNGFGGGNGITVQISSNACQIITSDGITTAAGTQFQDEVWHHVAVVRNASNSIKYYVDGTQVGLNISYSGNTTSTSCRIGATNAATPGNLFQGYIANARVTNAEVYTSNFTPPTTPLIGISNTQLVMYNGQDANVYDAAAANGLTLVGNTQSSTTQRKFTTSSAVYLDGTGDYIDTDTSELFAFGTKDFTWEMWIYHTVYEPAYLLEFGTGGNLGIHHASAQGHLTYYTSTTGTGSTLFTTGFGSMSVNAWYHIAAVRDNGTTYLYTNGVLQTSASDTTDYGSSALRCRIGAYGQNGTFEWTGYIQDLRITKGYARYTAAFTPPTAEFEL